MNKRFIFPILIFIFFALDIFDDLFGFSGDGFPTWIILAFLFPAIAYFSNQEEKKRRARKEETFDRTTVTEAKPKSEQALNSKPLSDEFAIDPEDYKL